MLNSPCLVLVVFVLTSPVLTAVVENKPNVCFLDEFTCDDGTCVGLNSLCDGRLDCPGGADEKACDVFGGSLNKTNVIWSRTKRQAPTCRKNQWQCRDGSCISFDGKCDGVIDCSDGSDETFPLCRKLECQTNWFRCTYGACVDNTAPCNGIQDCADNSDELLPQCRNETDVRRQFKCNNGQMIPASEHCDGVADCADGSDETLETCAAKSCPGYLFQCAYGACVDQGSDCNGKIDCVDGSDESDELCNRIGSGTNPVTRPPVTIRPVLGGKCKLPPYPRYGTYAMANNPNAVPGQTFYSVKLNISCGPGLEVEDKLHNIWCTDGDWSNNMPKCVRVCRLRKHPSIEYRCLSTGDVTGSRQCDDFEPAGTEVTPICRTPNYYYPGFLQNMNCIDGTWDYIALCKPGLTPTTNITITINDNIEIYVSSNSYNNIVINNYGRNNNIKVTGAGNTEAKPNDFNINIVSKDAKRPNVVKTTTDNSYKYQIDQDDWRIGQAQVVRPADNEIADRSTKGTYNDPITYYKECGTITPDAKPLILGGRLAKRGELPWHAGIYSKLYKPYMQVCGGSLISTTAIISAAHCFWSDSLKKLPASNYTVAVGKIYRPWNDKVDSEADAQRSEVAEIKMTSRYQGSGANYQDDIAIVIVVTPFVYQPYIRPVCIDFDVNFDRLQLTPGTMGKVAGWGFTSTSGNSSPILKVVDLPVVSIDDCRAVSPINFRVYLTSDKICAGYTNGTTLCQGDSGGGLAFPTEVLATQRYYLRGIVSVSPSNDDACTAGTLVAFTQVIKHETFIRETA